MYIIVYVATAVKNGFVVMLFTSWNKVWIMQQKKANFEKSKPTLAQGRALKGREMWASTFPLKRLWLFITIVVIDVAYELLFYGK